jgi:hypothetical protein
METITSHSFYVAIVFRAIWSTLGPGARGEEHGQQLNRGKFSSPCLQILLCSSFVSTIFNRYLCLNNKSFHVSRKLTNLLEMCMIFKKEFALNNGFLSKKLNNG